MSQKAKRSQEVLLIPGSAGWEIWRSSSSDGFVLKSATEVREALAVEGVPPGNLTMAFPVRDVSAAPFVAATGEEGMFRDLADLHLERSGLRGSQTSGSLTDCFTLRTSPEQALLLPVVLSPPPEGGLPKKSPKAFDISARCLPLPETAIVLWREFGRWVFAVTDEQRQPLYFQALPGALFDQQLIREVSLGVSQLEIQQVLTARPNSCLVWTGEGEIAPSAESLSELGHALAMPVAQAAKPAPRLPEVMSRLLPSDIRAERLALQKTRQNKLIAVTALFLYLGVIGFLTWKYQEMKGAKAVAEKEARLSSPAAEEVALFTSKWSELQPIVENEYWPVEQYFQAYQAAPKAGLRITRAEMRNEFQVQDGQGQVIKRSITLIGESDEAKQAVQFGENLGGASYFAPFDWNIPSPKPTKTDTWGFEYVAATPSTVL